MKKEILKNVLNLMCEKSIPLSKINIQKIVFFLRETGIPLEYKYEPYLYGPYSSELKADLDNLAMWDFLSSDKSHYAIKDGNSFSKEIDNDIITSISGQIDSFATAIKNKFDFDTMEISGTIIYCIKALKDIGMSPDEEGVINEFKNWKGTRYNDEQIKKIYANIEPLIN